MTFRHSRPGDTREGREGPRLRTRSGRPESRLRYRVWKTSTRSHSVSCSPRGETGTHRQRQFLDSRGGRSRFPSREDGRGVGLQTLGLWVSHVRGSHGDRVQVQSERVSVSGNLTVLTKWGQLSTLSHCVLVLMCFSPARY